MTLRLGTRGSWLARAQSRIVTRLLGARFPDLHIELVNVNTRGDTDRTTPLTQVDDQRFFSAELDAALLNGDIDFCVHSLKDLPYEPTTGISRVALVLRDDPRDVVVFRQNAADRARRGQPLRIGSSSTRRQCNVARFLPSALPQGDRKAHIDFAPLRGPVEQRLQPLAKRPGDPQALDGVILALAGLARLWNEPRAHAALEPLLRDKRWMVLPLTECPTAPGQGVLALECRADDDVTSDLLAALHHESTARKVAAEQSSLAALPASIRNASAATSIHVDALGPVTFVSRPDTAPTVIWTAPPKPNKATAWDGQSLYGGHQVRRLSLAPHALNVRAVFVAHWRAWPSNAAVDASTRIWVSGVGSWRRLAARGLWVEGCADNLGFENLTDTLATRVLQLPPLADWTALTAEQSVPGWRRAGVGRVLPSYDRVVTVQADSLPRLRRELSRATHFYWGSVSQFNAVSDWLPTGAKHYCGPGKTADALRELGVEYLVPVPSRKAWQAWLA